jgi:DNA (cytosine-5)-methyltransferase 1
MYGSPLSYAQLQELIPDLQEIELEKLIEKKIFIKTESGSFEFLNCRMSSGINGTYQIFLPTARFFGTLTARGINNEITQIAVSGESPAEYKQNFIKQILRPKLHRP